MAAMLAFGTICAFAGDSDGVDPAPAAVTPGSWNPERTQYIDPSGTPVKGLFLAVMKDSEEAGLYYAGDDGYVLGTVEAFRGVVHVTEGKKYIYLDDEWVRLETDKEYLYYIDNAGDPYITHSSGIYGGSSKYYVRSDGTIRTARGIVTAGSERYFVQEGGAVKTTPGLVTNTVSSGSSYRYYVQEGGPIRTEKGVFEYNDYHYLIKSDSGSIATKPGFATLDGKRYYVKNENGVLACDRTVTRNDYKYHAGDDCVILTGAHKYHDSYYLANAKGVLSTKKGVRTYDNKLYFVKTAGGKIAYNEKIKSGGYTYFAGKSNGRLKTGVFQWKNGKYYYCDGKGKLNTKEGIFTYKSNHYYNAGGGGLPAEAMVTYNFKHYYAGNNAAFVTKTFTYQGYTIHPDSKTGEISFSEWNKINGNKFAAEEYVDVSIANQHLVYYINGEPAVDTLIVSGTPGKKNAATGKACDTKTGKFKLQSKQTNQTVSDDDGTYTAKYWMNYSSDNPVNRQMTICDAASWRQTFGGTYYKTKGSNGEILIPASAAKTLYNYLQKGTQIIIS